VKEVSAAEERRQKEANAADEARTAAEEKRSTLILTLTRPHTQIVEPKLETPTP
jgi:hypothetical protein